MGTLVTEARDASKSRHAAGEKRIKEMRKRLEDECKKTHALEHEKSELSRLHAEINRQLQSERERVRTLEVECGKRSAERRSGRELFGAKEKAVEKLPDDLETLVGRPDTQKRK